MTYYNISKILEIMKNYHIYHDNLTTDNKDYASVGVTVYGIEATLPKPQGGTSDVTATEALKGIDDLPIFSLMRTDKKYIDDRLCRITDKLDIEITALRLEGLTIRDIGVATGLSKSHVQRKLVDIATIIKNGTSF